MIHDHQIDATHKKIKGEQITASSISAHVIKLLPTQVAKDL